MIKVVQKKRYTMDFLINEINNNLCQCPFSLIFNVNARQVKSNHFRKTWHLFNNYWVQITTLIFQQKRVNSNYRLHFIQGYKKKKKMFVAKYYSSVCAKCSKFDITVIVMKKMKRKTGFNFIITIKDVCQLFFNKYQYLSFLH